MVKLVELVKNSGLYNLREVYINPKHVVYLREDVSIKKHLMEGKLPAGLDNRQSFTKVFVDNGTTGTEFVVVGKPSMIELKLNGDNRTVLNG